MKLSLSTIILAFVSAIALPVMVGQRLTLAGVVNVANVQVLKAAGDCLPKGTKSSGLFYPPIECQENYSQLRFAKRLFEKILPFCSESNRYSERWIELEFTLNEMDAAADDLSTWRGQATGSALHPGRFVFHLLTSRIREKEGDILQAIYEARTGLDLAAARWSDTREQTETVRLASLHAAYVSQAQPDEVASYTYQAGVYAACAADWSMAYAQMLMLVGAESPRGTLSPQQKAISELIVDFVVRQQGYPSGADPLTAIGKISLGPRNAGDPFLWLGNQLMDFNPNLCWHGALPIYQWRAAAVSESGQGALLAGRALAEYGNWLEAQKYLQEAIAREPHNSRFAFELASYLNIHGDMEGAIPWYRKAFELEPLNAYYAVRVAGAYLTVGQTEQALFYADLSMELYTDITPPRIGAAWVYRDLGQYEAARRAFEAALRLDPDNAYARNGLRALTGK